MKMQKTKSNAFLLGRKSGKKILAIFNLKFTLASLQKIYRHFKHVIAQHLDVVEKCYAYHWKAYNLYFSYWYITFLYYY